MKASRRAGEVRWAETTFFCKPNRSSAKQPHHLALAQDRLGPSGVHAPMCTRVHTPPPLM